MCWYGKYQRDQTKKVYNQTLRVLLETAHSSCNTTFKYYKKNCEKDSCGIGRKLGEKATGGLKEWLDFRFEEWFNSTY